MKTDIVMVTWERPDITDLAIRTIKRNTKSYNYRLIVVDNGSGIETRERLMLLHDNGYIDELLMNSTNKGLEPARNQGLAVVQSDWFICADSDCLPQPIDDNPCIKCRTDWIEQLYNLQRLSPEYMSIACRTQVMIGTGNIFDGHENEGLLEFPHPGGSLRLMNTELVRDLGGWRNEVSGRGAEERYIGAKISEAGYKSAFAINVRCLHLFGKKDSDRWGYDPTWKPEETGHSDIYHPILERGDDYEEVKEYAGEEYAKRYFTNM